MTETGIYLYYANWCGHCVQFKPEWEKIKAEIDKAKKEGKMITYEEYEDGANKDVMEREGIGGYPTIRIKKNGEMKEYTGPRNAKVILEILFDKSEQQTGDDSGFKQCGGGKLEKSKRYNDREYKIKYLKYKAKYLKLHSNLRF